jgi:formin-binding protein 1
MYTARVALEREYAGKLQGLVRKFSEKKAKTGASFVIGNEPSKSWDLSTVLSQR